MNPRTLADISKLEELDRSTLAALRARMTEVGFTSRGVAEALARFESGPPVIGARVRNYHLRKQEGDAAKWMRLLMFSDVLDRAEAEAAIGPLYGALARAGVLVEEGGTVSSPLRFGLIADVIVLCDRMIGELGVMGFGTTTISLLHASVPTKPRRTALEVGCGAGTIAIRLARHATRVVATDIDPRAIAFTKFNARLNAVDNVDAREGDMLAPVAGETFDLVVSQPPYLPVVGGEAHRVVTQGGTRGDELALRLLAGLPKVLARGGLAVIRSDWLVPRSADGQPDPDGALARARQHLGEDLDLTIVSGPPVGLDGYAMIYAAGAREELDQGFVDDYAARRDHLDGLGAASVLAATTLVHRSGEKPASTSFRWTGPNAAFSPQGVQGIVAARALARDDKKLLAAKVRVPKGTVFAEEQVGPGAEVESTLRAQFAPTALAVDIEMDRRLLFVLTALHEEPSVRDAIARYAAQTETDVAEAEDLLLPIIRDAVLQGFVTTEE